MKESSSAPWGIGNPANALTMFRILSTPFVLLVLSRTEVPSWPVCGLWFLVSISDVLDGYVARRWSGPSRSGAYLDPLADKISTLGALIVLVARGWFWWLPVALIAFREVAMTYYRSRVAAYGVSVPAKPWAKVKAWAQGLAIGFLLMPFTFNNVPWLANACLWTGVVLAYYSGAEYFLAAMRSSRRTVTASQ